MQYAFYSAANAVALQQERRDATAGQEEAEQAPTSEFDVGGMPRPEPSAGDGDSDDDVSVSDSHGQEESSEDDTYFSAEEDTTDGQDIRTKVLSAVELEELFLKAAPDLSGMKFSLKISHRSHPFY